MNLTLCNFKSNCTEKQKIIVSKEKKNSHIANNIDNNSVRQLKIDGYVITDNNIKKAINQIEQTIKKLEKDLIKYNKKMRIVYSGTVDSGTINDWKYKNKNANAGRNKFEENI